MLYENFILLKRKCKKVYSVDMKLNIDFKNKWILIGLFILGFTLRFLVSRFGYNYDYESWIIVGEITSKFKNIFAETSRYNYGFIWAYLIGLYYAFISELGLSLGFYRVLIIFTLTLADFGIAYFIYKKSNIKIAILFFFNPISIFISGYHNQFDNIAIMLALFGILALEKAIKSNKINQYDILSLLLISLSLITKHIVFTLPIWLFFSKELNIKRKILYLVTPPTLFLMNFVMFLPEGYNNILNNVFLYDSYNNMPLLSRFLPFFSAYHSSIFRNIFLLGMVIFGWIVRKEKIDKLIIVYLLIMFSITSAMANQYFIMPLVGLFLLGGIEKRIYLIWMSIYFIFQFDGLDILNYLLSNVSSDLLTLQPLYHLLLQLISDFVAISYSVASWLCFITILRELGWLEIISQKLLKKGEYL